MPLSIRHIATTLVVASALWPTAHALAQSATSATVLQSATDPTSISLDTARRAAVANTTAASSDWGQWQYMFGDLGGIRPFLSRHGIDLAGHWMSESAGNPIGGRKQDVKYTQHFDINVVADAEKLLGWKGGTFKLNILNRSGGDLSSHVVGNWQTIQQIYGAGQDNRLAEMSYTQMLDRKHWELKIGYMPVGNDFGREIYGCDFMNVSLCAHPMVLSYDSGWRNNPKGSWGFKVRHNFPKEIYFSTGVYQSDPHNGGHDNGFKLTMTGSGVVIPMEMGWEPNKALHMLPGHYRVGAYYDNSHLADAYYDRYDQPAGLTGRAFRQDKGHYGIYAMFDQQLTTFDGDPSRGVVVWGGMGYSNPQMSVAQYEFAAQGSIMLLGPFRSRPHDLLGIAWARLSANQMHQDYLRDVALTKDKAFIRANAENLVEVDYGFAVTPWLNLRPNLQYIMAPAGTHIYRDAFAIGLDTKITM